MIRMRKEVPEISWGDFAILRTSRDDVLAIRYDWRNNSVVCVHNFSAAACTVKFRVGPAAGDTRTLVNLLSDDHGEADAAGRHTRRAGALRIPLVSRGRAGLSAQAQRSLNLSDICPESCWRGAHTCAAPRLVVRLKRPPYKALPELARSVH